MFKSKTVFVVGAGASCEAGLPSGEKLKGQIADLLDIRFEDGFNQNSGDRQITQALREAVMTPEGRAGDINPYLYKAWRIRDVVPAAAISIDNYLDAHQGDLAMELCGKLAIVRSILNAESQSKLKYQERGVDRFNLRDLMGSWYVGFFQMLTENVSKANIKNIFDNVSIITFNYDRCIEQFLVQTLSDYYEITYEDAAKIVEKLNIFHPYGKVGPLPWQDRSKAIPFGSQNAKLLDLARQIKTFSEGLDDEALIGGMHSAIAASETIIFLGFAFHPNNMNLLTPPQEVFPKRVFATTLGLSDSDESVIENDIFRMLGKSDYDFQERMVMKPEMAKMPCGEFFQQYFRSLSAPVDEDA